jgi:mevalonate kinase
MEDVVQLGWHSLKEKAMGGGGGTCFIALLNDMSNCCHEEEGTEEAHTCTCVHFRQEEVFLEDSQVLMLALLIFP